MLSFITQPRRDEHGNDRQIIEDVREKCHKMDKETSKRVITTCKQNGVAFFKEED